MQASLISLFLRENSEISFLSFLNSSSFDELIRIDLKKDHYKFIYNIDDKYEIPATEGVFSRYYAYTAQHLSGEGGRLYAETLEPTTLARRLRESEQPGVLQMEFQHRDVSGGWRWVNLIIVGEPVRDVPEGCVFVYVFDIQNIKNREAGVTRVSDRNRRKDPLTGLLREKNFFKTAENLLSNRTCNWKLMVIDLEEFKLFNEWYGRETGDRVLRRVGETLGREAEKLDGLAGYMGNDDFCLLMPGEDYDEEGLLRAIHNAILDYSVSVGFQPSIGVALSNGNASVLNLYDQASLACQLAKEDFRERIKYFKPSMYRETTEDYQILSDFQAALKNREICFYLQPSAGRATAGSWGRRRWCAGSGPTGR